MSIAYIVMSVPYLVFSVFVLLNLGRWSSIKSIIPTLWRLTLGVLWLISGVGLLIAGVIHKVTLLVWVPVVAGAVVYIIFFLKKAREGLG